jgi:hypothetical protein
MEKTAVSTISDLDFSEYLDDRQIAESDGFFVIIPDDISTVVPIKCDVCDYVFRTSDDEKAYCQFKCCAFCAKMWAQANREKWAAGWRPDVETIQKAQPNRNPISFVLK